MHKKHKKYNLDNDLHSKLTVNKSTKTHKNSPAYIYIYIYT